MEVRLIKTCHGLQEVRFLDGALLSEHVDLGEVSSVELIELLPMPEIPQAMLGELNQITLRIFQALRFTQPHQTD